MGFTIEHARHPATPASGAPRERGYDPELLIVECSRCGRPVLWEPGRSTAVLAGVGIDPVELDAHCLLLTEGCPHCCPRQQEGYNVRVFRLTPAQGGGFGVKSAGNA